MRKRGIPARVEFLRQLPAFRGCSKRELMLIDSCMDDLEVPGGYMLTREGAIGHEAYVVVSGEAAVTVRGETVAVLRRGDIFGEMALLSSPPRRAATVTANSPMRVLVTNPRRFGDVIEIPSVRIALLRALVDRIRSLEHVGA